MPPITKPTPDDLPSVLTAALRLYDRGLYVVPCVGKRAIWEDWPTRRRSREELAAALSVTGRNIALVVSQTDWIDVECDTDAAEAAFQGWFGGDVPLPAAAARRAWDALLRAAKPTERRVVAAGYRRVIASGVMGYYRGEATGFTRHDRQGWQDVWPLLAALDRVFRQECPAQYAVLAGAAAGLPRRLVVPGTAFTTATVNRTARMAVHRDKGNLPGGFGALTAIEAGDYSGGLLVFPRFRVAVDLRSCDVLLADTHEAHGNTEFVGAEGEYERVSVVCYVHADTFASKVSTDNHEG